MRQLAIGDIHGCYRALKTLEAFVPFQADDLVITLGDYVDRGPDSCAVVDWLIERHRRRGLVALRGNHEIMMFSARDDRGTLDAWLQYGGKQTLASYASSGLPGELSNVPAAHWEFLEHGTLPFFELETHFFVHANAYADFPLDEQPDQMLFWEKFEDPPPHCSGKVMVCGHTSQKSGKPLSLGHAVCIDTWVYGDGWLTCLDVASGKYWQASERGETRSDWLA